MAFTPITSQNPTSNFTPLNQLQPNQASAVLGHSNSLMSNIIGGAENLLPTAGAIAGGIGGAAAGGLAGIESGPGAIATGYLGGVAGSGAGAAAGEALKEKLQGGPLQGGEIAKQGVLNAAFDAVGGPLLSMGGKALQLLKSPISKIGGKIASDSGLGTYKSAEEFVKAQTPIYHGTMEKFTKFSDKKGFGGTAWFSDNKEAVASNRVEATKSAGANWNVMERYINPEIKLVDRNTAEGKKLDDSMMKDQLRSMGYGGIKHEADAQRGSYIELFNPSKDAWTKSQLTELYNSTTNKASGNSIFSSIGKGMEKAGSAFGAKPVAEAITERSIKPPVKLATTRLASTEETMTKGEREQAILDGRMTPKGKFNPSATEKRAGEIMSGKTFSNPVKTTKAIQNEISTRVKEAETYLEQNAKPISNEEDFNAFNKMRSLSEKYMTPAEANAYDEQIGVFQKILKGFGKYNTANYYKAVKEYESKVTANLPKGKDALLTPGGSARIQAAKDVRQVVRDTIGDKNPEYKGKMFDLASLYDSLDNVVSKAEKGGHSLTKRYPKTAAVVGTVAAYEGNKILKDTTGFGL